MSTGLAFDFGLNWKNFSENRLDAGRFEAAKLSLVRLLGTEGIKDRSFLDVGCGTGVFALAAAELGAARVVGVDVNPLCVEVARRNGSRGLVGVASIPVEFRQTNALDSLAMTALGSFDIVYAWGSLHHTGRMWEAIGHAADRVSQGGILVLAIYNRHWTSPIWLWIKRIHNFLPRWGRKGMTWLFVPMIALAKWIATGRNPLRKDRGMDFYYDVVDWIGGYPYECETAENLKARLDRMGFDLTALYPSETPIGNNELVFKRR